MKSYVAEFMNRTTKLRQLGGYKFRRQQPLGPYIVGFVCLEQRLIVEVDGGQHAEQADEDAQRTAWLEAQGFRVLRGEEEERPGQCMECELQRRQRQREQ